MTVTTERHEADPTHGRPRILTIKGREGEVSVHVDRESKALWLFATGPRGGDRGRWAVAPSRTTEVQHWLAGVHEPIYGAEHYLRVVERARTGARVRQLELFKSAMGRWFTLELDGDAEAELRLAVGTWVEACEAAGAREVVA
jgi:hypothetical protein